jgi:hypothetical protein
MEWRRRFLPAFFTIDFTLFRTSRWLQVLIKVVWLTPAKWPVDHSVTRSDVFSMESQTETQTPCSDRKETKGLVYFARMLDKIRLKAAGKLPPDYFVGVDDDPTVFDARCTRFLGVDYDELATRTLQGGSDEEVLQWCFEHGRRPSEEEITVWNAFLLKRGWRDEASPELQEAKERSGFGNRHDIQTWVDFHDVEEGRKPGR